MPRILRRVLRNSKALHRSADLRVSACAVTRGSAGLLARGSGAASRLAADTAKAEVAASGPGSRHAAEKDAAPAAQCAGDQHRAGDVGSSRVRAVRWWGMRVHSQCAALGDAGQHGENLRGQRAGRACLCIERIERTSGQTSGSWVCMCMPCPLPRDSCPTEPQSAQRRLEPSARWGRSGEGTLESGACSLAARSARGGDCPCRAPRCVRQLFRRAVSHAREPANHELESE